jgi:peptidoglycan/xylan/chitin deacetylase (PgdA/CDA1 family)
MWPGTVDALLPIIDNLLAEGFALVTVPELIGHQPPGTVLRHGAR